PALIDVDELRERGERRQAGSKARVIESGTAVQADDRGPRMHNVPGRDQSGSLDVEEQIDVVDADNHERLAAVSRALAPASGRSGLRCRIRPRRIVRRTASGPSSAITASTKLR